MSNATITTPPLVKRVECSLSMDDTHFLIHAHANWTYAEDDEVERVKYIFRNVFGMPTGYPADKTPPDFRVKPDGTEQRLDVVNSPFGFLAAKTSGYERKYWAMCIEEDQTLTWRTVKAFKSFKELSTEAATFNEFLCSINFVRNVNEPPPSSDEDYSDTDYYSKIAARCRANFRKRFQRYADSGEGSQSHTDSDEEAQRHAKSGKRAQSHDDSGKGAQSHDDSV